MAVLIQIPGRALALCLLVTTSSCYAPSFASCAVACESAAECGPAQLCTTHWCTGPEHPGACPGAGVDAAVDSGTSADAARPRDAARDAAPDAAPDAGTVQLVIKLVGGGRVEVPGVGICLSTAPGHTCAFDVPVGVPRTLSAVPDAGQVFERWQPGTCALQGASCSLGPIVAATTATARFKGD